MRWFASLRRAGEFARLRRRGRHAGLATLAAYGLDGRGGSPRIGITVSKAVGQAVVRNRIRRRVAGALDALAGSAGGAPVSSDVLFVVRPSAAQTGYAALAADVTEALARVARAR